jgi:cold shock CspA family protein
MAIRPVLAKDGAMKHFGTVQSFDDATGHGFIKPENGGRDLDFKRSSMQWDRMVSPRRGLRLSYHLSGKNGQASAVDVQTVPVRPQGSARKPFSIFLTAAEEVATDAELDEGGAEGGRMNSTEQPAFSTLGADTPSGIDITHGEFATTECPFPTVRECRIFTAGITAAARGESAFLDKGPFAL